MPPAPSRLVFAALLALGSAAPVVAEISTSFASSASSASVGSLSDSISGSSHSSRSADKPVTAGDYRIVEVMALAERAGRLRVKLQGDGGELADASFYLDLPQTTFERQGLATGDRVRVSERAYGLAFARAELPREAFFLVLADDWYRDLDARALKL